MTAVRPIWSSRRTIAGAAVPIVLALTLAWHPPDPARADQLAGMLGRWLTIHAVLLVAMPTLALLVLRLVDGIPGLAARLARRLVVPAAALYATFDGLLGLGTGVLVNESSRLPESERAGAAALAQVWWEVPPLVAVVSGFAVVTWTAAIAATAVAIHRAGDGTIAPWALAVSALLFAAGHPGPTGAAAMLAFAVAVVSVGRRHRTRPAVDHLDDVLGHGR